ncbi:MAG: flagellar filament capping protein FliD [Betaproteobacteria bacterium]|nr:flagellar filament capping protein FliD [Betaproteobacteria bacterium]MBP6188306.1 flagellar filament capping protein FliD [Azonexus sp.]MBP6202595.1 flagellar filament capping protein FliD [Azonexus sp.]
MAVSSLGVGSGLDLNNLLTSLMQAEQQPLVALQRKEASFQSRISALGSLKGSLSSLQTAAQGFIPTTGQTALNKYASFSATVADNTIASASASTGSVAGVYSLEVSALAAGHRLTSPNSTDLVGTAALTAGLAAGGTLKIELGALTGTSPALAFAADSARELNVTVAAGATLENVRDAINTAATDGRISATIVNGTNGKQLVLSSTKTGTENVMKLSGIGGLDFNPAGAGTGTLSQATVNGGQAASNAAFKLNGIAATSSTNTVTGVLDGVTLTLSKTNVGTPTNLTVTKDSTTSLTTAVNSFVKTFNEAAKSMKDLGYFNADTKQAGALQGDSTLRGATSQVRSLLQTTAGGSSAYQTLSNIGIALQTDGTLKLDTTKLNAAIAADYAGVTSLVSTVGTRFKESLEGLVGTSGNITAATDSANRLIKDLGKRQTALLDRLNQVEARYRKQFSALDTLVASMNKTSSYLTQQLANLPGAASS